MIKKLKNNITLLNTISSLILQIFMILSGFIIPKIILSYFGSSVNGLVSSLNQFLSYIALLEGGVTGVIMANLYKPLYEKDEKKISSIVKTTDKFYKKIGLIFIIYAVILSIVYPIFFNVEFSYIYVMSLTLVLSVSLFIQYCFSLTLKTLLNADKKVYIVSLTQVLIIVLNIILAIVSVKVFPSIHVLKIITGVLFILQPAIYGYFAKKYYKIDKNVEEDSELLQNRWNGFAINIAAFIHNSTDIVILTLFTDLSIVSIYSVYALVTNGLRSIISSVASGITPSIGHLYVANNKEELNKKFDIYEYIIFILVFLLFSVAGLLITPFVMIYTKNVTDANYYQPLFGILLLISEALYLIKYPYLSLSYSANKFKKITIPCYIEAGLNIVVSLLLVNKFGLIGVAIGTIIAMLYRMIFHVYYTKKDMIYRPQRKFYKSFIIFSITTLIGIFICLFLVPSVKYSIISWIIHGIIYFIIMSILYLVISVIFYKDEIKYFKKFLLRGK